MAKVILESVAGTMVELGSGQVKCSYPGRVVTALMMLVAVFWSLGVIAMVVGLVQGGPPQIVLGALVGAAAVGGMVLLIRRRQRTMGQFLIDGPAGELLRLDAADTVLARHPLANARFERRWDPFHRSIVQRHWVLARVDGATYRLGKGEKDEVDAACRRLAELAEACREATPQDA